LSANGGISILLHHVVKFPSFRPIYLDGQCSSAGLIDGHLSLALHDNKLHKATAAIDH